MLTEEQKTRIAEEEQYRNELAQKSKVKSKTNVNTDTIIKILQAVAIIAGIWATYFAYKKHVDERKIREKEQLQQTAKEFRKSFYEKQFQYYAEATEATATLATEEIGSEDYNKARKTFYRLFWGRLSLVEDKTVEARMVQFKNLLEKYEQKAAGATQDELKQASLRLAHDASSYTINVWIDSSERKNYNRGKAVGSSE